jgi:hypothetical protein
MEHAGEAESAKRSRPQGYMFYNVCMHGLFTFEAAWARAVPSCSNSECVDIFVCLRIKRQQKDQQDLKRRPLLCHVKIAH